MMTDAPLTISVLGCGWLGLPLARYLRDAGWRVRGSTTDADNVPSLVASGVEPFILRCDPELRGDGLTDFFQSRVLFLNLPFTRQLADPGIYRARIESVVSRARAGKTRWVIFASSTSVYPDDMIVATEDADFFPDNPRSEILRGIERGLLESEYFDTTVIRFAGLYGPGRPFGGFLSGRGNLSRGRAPVNLIHLDDCLGVVGAVLGKGARNDIFNACGDSHPSRKDLYTKAALFSGLPAPEFSDDNRPASGKIVSNQKVKDRLGYRFSHPDPLKEVGLQSGQLGS
jgi:nucleoside-diphosphate-sugar epimerase